MRVWFIALLIPLSLIPEVAEARQTQQTPAQSSSAVNAQAQALRGRKLFTGEIPFEKGGPSCSECHTLAGFSLPTGKIRGPDLTHEYSKLGSDGMDAALQLLPFADMIPLYESRPLTAEEQSNLKAFLVESDQENPVVPPIPLGSAERGEALFSGRAHFGRGGPPCAACHNVAGLPFPQGGTLGPDLTHTYSKLGAEGVDTALQTLFFPAMTPLYEAHQLTPPEQSDLKAFFQQEDARPLPGVKITIVFLLAGLAGFMVLTILAAAFWRDRLRSVRKRLVETASR